MGKRVILCVVWLFIILSLTACGKNEEVRERGINGYIYMSEDISGGFSSETLGRMRKLKCRGNYLYYVIDSSIYGHILDVDSGMQAQDRVVVYTDKNKGIIDYTVDESGNIYYFSVEYSTDYVLSGVGIKEGRLIGQKEDGTLLYNTAFPVSSQDDVGSYTGCLALDDEKCIFLLVEDFIYVIDEDGKEIGSISVEEYGTGLAEGKQGLLEGPGGGVYYCSDNSTYGGLLKVFEIGKENGGYNLKLLEEEEWGQRGVNGVLFTSPRGMMYNRRDGILRLYNEEEGKWQDLLRWSDSCLTWDASEIIPVSEEHMLVFYSTLSEPEVYLLTKTPVEELPEKEELVLACYIGCSTDVQKAVAEFNRANDKYHITVELFWGIGAEAKLDARIVSSNPPDMLDMMNLDMQKYADSQTLEDYSPYLDASSVLEREMFLDNVLEGYTFAGKLVCIPARIYCYTVLGRASRVGEGVGWDMDEVRALAEEYPEYGLFCNSSFSFMLEDFGGDYILEEYVDWENGRCNFDSDSFRDLVEWMEGCRSGERDACRWGQVPEDVLMVADMMFMAVSFVNREGDFGENYVIKGFPTADGRPLHRGVGGEGVCILTNSRHKEGAWSFVEYLLGEHQEGRDEASLEFSSRRDLLAKLAADLVEVEYWRDEAGEIIRHDTGPAIKVRGERFIDGKWQPYYNMSQEEVDRILEIVSTMDFKPRSAAEREIFRIIEDETEGYFEGYQSLEEVSRVIQNRVQLLIQEHG